MTLTGGGSLEQLDENLWRWIGAEGQILNCSGDLTAYTANREPDDPRSLAFRQNAWGKDGLLPWQNAWGKDGYTSVLLKMVVNSPANRLFWTWGGPPGQRTGEFRYVRTAEQLALAPEVVPPLDETEFFDMIDFSDAEREPGSEPGEPDQPPFFRGPPFTLDCNSLVFDQDRYTEHPQGNLTNTDPALGRSGPRNSDRTLRWKR